MAVSVGSVLSSYELTALLGKGGFGEVYRARDRKLKREVAIKVLPDEFSRDRERVSRFQREAEVLASLNHPNIAAIYDFAATSESQFLVLELVDGETLAERIGHGRIPVDEALGIACQIAGALEAAHHKGVIHRDLKPANIKIALDGKVKVLDFGLAKIQETVRDVPSLSESPTLMTAPSAGTLIGTAAYMSPEQARGRDVGPTADVWAFGCVLYEMLTGAQAFQGESLGELLGEIFKGEPDWSQLPETTPPPIRRLLRRCLNKDVHRRFQHTGDIRIEIEEANSTEDMAPPPAMPAAVTPARKPLIVVTMLLSLVSIALALLAVRPPVEAPELRLDINTPPTSDLSAFAVSPDGLKIAYAAISEGQSKLWIRSLDSTDAHPISGTEQGSTPFWSPDGRALGFFANGKLKRVDIAGGTPQTLGEAPFYYGGTWNSSGVILYSPGAAGPIYRVSDLGGPPTPVTKVDPTSHSGHTAPQFLPDGNHFLFYIFGLPDVRGVYVGALDGSAPRRLVDAEIAGAIFSADHLFFVNRGTLFAQKFDTRRLEMSGSPFAVSEGIAVDNTTPALAGSAHGPIAFRSGTGAGSRQLIWFDRTGKLVRRVGEPDNAGIQGAELSPDEKQVAASRNVNGNSDVWLLDTDKGILSRFTLDPAFDVNPAWSPDSQRVAFTSNRKGSFSLFAKALRGGAEELLVEGPEGKSPTDWSRDGKFILYRKAIPNTGFDLMAVTVDAEHKTVTVSKNGFDSRDGQFSPDGKWVAYQSNESGRYEIYIQAFPEPAGKKQISTGGGSQVRWRSDGKELFYLAPDGRLMAVPIQSDSAGAFIDHGAPVALFQPNMVGSNNAYKQQYAVSRDGQKFLINTPLEGSMPITLILNWKAKGK